MLGYFQKYIHVKTPALFSFEMYSAQVIQPRIIILENLFVAVSYDVVTGATNKSMNGKHWTIL